MTAVPGTTYYMWNNMYHMMHDVWHFHVNPNLDTLDECSPRHGVYLALAHSVLRSNFVFRTIRTAVPS